RGTKAVRSRHVYQFPGHPGATRPGAGENQRAVGDSLLRSVTRRFRSVATGRASSRRRHGNTIRPDVDAIRCCTVDSPYLRNYECPANRGNLLAEKGTVTRPFPSTPMSAADR